jgi:hypothetical protein
MVKTWLQKTQVLGPRLPASQQVSIGKTRILFVYMKQGTASELTSISDGQAGKAGKGGRATTQRAAAAVRVPEMARLGALHHFLHKRSNFQLRAALMAIQLN